MLKSLRRLFASEPARATAAIPPGERVYAVGDIHGRLDLFAEMIAAIERDDSVRGSARSTVILLGDLVDRGPDSAGVVAAARNWQQNRPVRIIAGNHEEMFLRALRKEEVLRTFLRHGGRETLLSYPIPPQAYAEADFAGVQDLMRTAIPLEDIAFMEGFEQMIAIGDYLFVHAGILPEVPLDAQRTTDLRWIREPFLSFPGNHGYVVVHGHTITEEPQVRPNRIGIDTGAFASGRLTALCLEGTERWLIEAREDEGVISAHTRSIA